jgi:hypothetical protein
LLYLAVKSTNLQQTLNLTAPRFDRTRLHYFALKNTNLTQTLRGGIGPSKALVEAHIALLAATTLAMHMHKEPPDR